MIDSNKYQKLEEKYGACSSWMIWKEQSGKPKSNITDMSVFDSPDLLKMIGTGYIFVGLNVSGAVKGKW